MALDNLSAQWKIERAKELLDGLDAEVKAWFDTKPYSLSPYISPNYRRACVYVKAQSDPPKVRWSLMVADIVHNLRCALDHTFWAVLLNEFSGTVPPKADKLTFPIWDAPPNSEKRKPFKPIGAKLLTAVESVQLYNHPSTKFPVHPLAIIRDIDNANKHKLLFTVIPSLGRIEIKATGLRKSSQDDATNELYRGELKDGVEAVVTTFDVPHPYMKYTWKNFSAIIAIVHPFANIRGEDRDDYAALIDHLVIEVNRVIAALIIAAT